MKKITKRIMALMLSLVMILGCIPSFVNEASADDVSNITFENLDDVKTVGDIAITNYTIVGKDSKSYVHQDCGSIVFKIYSKYDENEEALNSDMIPVKEQNYIIKAEVNTKGDFLYNDTEQLSSWEDLGLTDNFNINVTGITTWFVREPILKLEQDKLIFTAELETKYINNIMLDGDGEFNAGESSTYSYKAPANENYHVVETTWYTDEGCTAPLANDAILSDTATYYAIVIVEPNDGYYLATTTNYKPDIGSYDGVVKSHMGSNDSSLTCLVAKQTSRSTELTLAPINNKLDIFTILEKINTPDEGNYIKFTPQYNKAIQIGGQPFSSITNRIGEYLFSIEMFNGSKNGSDKDYSITDENFNYVLQTNSINSVKYNEKSYDVCDSVFEAANYSSNPRTAAEVYEFYNKLADYLLENEVLVVTNPNVLDHYENYKDAQETLSATVYQLYNFGRPGEITFSGLTAGNLVENISVDLGTNGITDIGRREIWVKEDGEYIKIEDLEGVKFETGKEYKIKSKFTNATYDINSLTINGQNVPVVIGADYPSETGCAVYNDGFTQGIFVTYNFSLQSSGGSKTYKAKDNNDTAEKISGSGKKGSKRIVTPEPNRKVESVIVTDKDGNRYEVTNEGDGTYSFIQPGKDVDVEVKYKNRLIELTIGSLDASVDDIHHQLDVVPKVVNDRTMLPIRFVAENLGAKVDWDEKDPNTVIITRGDTRIEITLGSDIAKVNGQEYILDSVAFAENDRTYLPVRFVSEKLNAIVEWNEAHPMDVKIYERQ